MPIMAAGGVGFVALSHLQSRPDSLISEFLAWGINVGGDWFLIGMGMALFFYFIWVLDYFSKNGRDRKDSADT